MKKYYALIATLTAFQTTVSASTTAESDCYPINNRQGIFSNVSSSGNASRDNPVTACTIINAKESIDSSTVFFAESPSGDAVLEIFYAFVPQNAENVKNMQYPENIFPKRTFDDWTDGISSQEIQLLEEKLRLPMSQSDSAAILRSDNLFYSYLFIATFYTSSAINSQFGVCASAYPKNGSSLTNVSITNLGPSLNDKCHIRSGLFFEK